MAESYLVTYVLARHTPMCAYIMAVIRSRHNILQHFCKPSKHGGRPVSMLFTFEWTFSIDGITAFALSCESVGKNPESGTDLMKLTWTRLPNELFMYVFLYKYMHIFIYFGIVGRRKLCSFYYQLIWISNEKMLYILCLKSQVSMTDTCTWKWTRAY